MNEKVTLPADLREKLAGANGRAVELCDDAGNVMGYYLSADRLAAFEDERRAAYAKADALVTEAELDAAERSGGSHTMDDVFKLLGKK